MARVKLTLVVCQDEDDKEDKENQLGEGVYKRPIFTYGMAKKRIKEMNDENNVNIIIYWTVSWLHRKHCINASHLQSCTVIYSIC